MKKFKTFMEEAPSMATTAVAGAGENPEKIVPVKKKKKKKPEVIDRMVKTEETEVNELSMSTKWKAGVARAIRGPSKKRRPVYMRTMDKAAKKNIARARKTRAYEMGRRHQASQPKLGVSR